MGKYRKVGTRWIDPGKVQTTVRSEAAVRGYVENPNWSGPDWGGNNGAPAVIRRADGTVVADNGNHRVEAAKRSGRKIKAEVWVERGSGEDKGSDSFFAWLFS
jgi:hypothetical protein